MKATEILAAWQHDVAAISTVKERVGYNEFSLPFSTLTNKFVRVYVKEDGLGGHLLWDGGDLHADEYEVGDFDSPAPYEAAKSLLGHSLYSEISNEAEGFYWRVPDPKDLTSAMLDMAQFIQLAVNKAALATWDCFATA